MCGMGLRFVSGFAPLESLGGALPEFCVGFADRIHFLPFQESNHPS